MSLETVKVIFDVTSIRLRSCLNTIAATTIMMGDMKFGIGGCSVFVLYTIEFKTNQIENIKISAILNSVHIS